MQSRSRLKKNQTAQDSSESLQTVKTGRNKISSLYLKHSPLLILSIIFLFRSVHILTTVRPAEVADILLHQGYVPLLIPFFLFVTLFTGYLTLNIKQGSVVGLFTTLFLLFKLQQIEFSLSWFLLFLFLFIICLLATKKPSRTMRSQFHTITPKSRQ